MGMLGARVASLLMAGLAASPAVAEAGTRALDVGDQAAPVFSAYGVEDGLSDEVWNTVGVAPDGFVWAGSASALARFDGYRWQLWPSPQTKSLVLDLEAAGGSLWATFQGQGLFRLDSGDWRPVVVGGGTPGNFLVTVAGDGRSEVWLGQEGGLWQHRDGGWREDAGNADAALENPLGMARTERLFGGPRQWLATSHGLWFRPLRGDHVDGAWQRPEDPALHALLATDVFSASDHGVEELWVTTYGQGIARYRADGVRWWRARTGELPSEAIYTGVATTGSDGERLAWLASRAGLLRVRGDQVTAFDRRHGLPSDAVRRLALQRGRDGEDLLWLATEGGIARAVLGRQPWQTVSHLGASENGIFGVLVEPDDRGGERLWVGSSKEGLDLFSDGRWRRFRQADGTLPAEGIRHIARVEGADGRPWRLLSLVDGSLWRIHDDLRFERIEVPWNLSDGDMAMAFLARSDGPRHELWIATLRAGIYRWRDGRFEQFVAPGMQLPWGVSGLAAHVDGDGRSWLWAASTQGLARFDGRRFERLAGIAGLPEDGFRGVTVLRDGDRDVLWAGSNRNGVVRLDVTAPMAPVALRSEELPPPPDPFVYSVRRDRSGRTYLCTNNGVQLLTPDGDGGFRSRVFRRRDGLVHDECNTGSQMIDEHDRYWVGTLAGLSMYDPARDQPPAAGAAAPVLHLTALQADGVDLLHGPGATPRVPAGTDELRIDFVLLSGQRERESRYRSQLLGYDAAPGEWRAEPGRSFPRLPPGRYVFRVEARDWAGRVSAPQVQAFDVAAHWWERDLARLAAVLAALATVALGVHLYLRAARQRARELEQQVAARTRELHAANARLTELSYLDPLTGIANRRRLMQALDAALPWAIQRGLPLGLIVLDVDHFKDYNDRHGHLAGDTALRAVAQALASAMREQDLVARYGGEEFACLMSDADIDVVAAVAERMRALVAALPPRTLGNDEHTLTLSAGVLSRIPRPDESAADLLREADAALYRAKHEGRNRVCRA